MQTDQVRRAASRLVMALLFLTVPFACALVAVAYAPPAHIEVAGQTVSVKPVLGQDTSRLLGGALVRPDHAHVEVIGKDIGVDVDADWNRLIPSDERTRAYLDGAVGRPDSADRPSPGRRAPHVWSWSGVGFLAGAAVVGLGVWSGLAYRRLGCGLPARAGGSRTPSQPPAALDAGRGRHGRPAWRWTSSRVRVYLHDDHHTVISSPVFAGTSLEGTEVNGLAAEVLPFLSILRPRSTFYDTVADNLERAIAQRPSLRRTERRGRAGARGGLRGRERDGAAGGPGGRPRRRELPRPHLAT